MNSIQFTIDTWLKLSTAQGDRLPDDQRQFIKAKTILPVSNLEPVGNHFKVTLGKDGQGNQLQYKGRNTWYVFAGAVEVLKEEQPIDSDSESKYAIKFDIDTWLKLTTDQGDKIPEDQRQFIKGGTVLPIVAFQPVGNHLKVTLGRDDQGRQVEFKDRNTWFVYEPAVEVLRDGEPMNLFPPASADDPSEYSVRFNADTWLKLNTGQSSSLPEEQKHLVKAKTVLPISSYTPEDSHLKISFAKDEQGNQVHFKGRNTWYVYAPTAEILKNGKLVDLSGPDSSASSASSGRINDKGLRLVKSFEGLRLKAYLDAVGVWTIGYGTTAGVRPGMKISKEQAEEFLKRDLRRFEAAVTKNVKVPINSDQFSALVAFTYNVGEGALASSTLLKKLNRKDYSGAANELLRWNKGGGKVLPGLTRRRKAERALFLGEDFTVFL